MIKIWKTHVSNEFVWRLAGDTEVQFVEKSKEATLIIIGEEHHGRTNNRKWIRDTWGWALTSRSNKEFQLGVPDPRVSDQRVARIFEYLRLELGAIGVSETNLDEFITELFAYCNGLTCDSGGCGWHPLGLFLSHFPGFRNDSEIQTKLYQRLHTFFSGLFSLMPMEVDKKLLWRSSCDLERAWLGLAYGDNLWEQVGIGSDLIGSNESLLQFIDFWVNAVIPQELTDIEIRQQFFDAIRQ